MSKTVRYVNGAWPSIKELSEIDQKFNAKRNELYVEKECLLWGYRVVVPESMKTRILSELQASHFGVVRMQMLARSNVWWPKIDSDIENVSVACRVCVQERNKPLSVLLMQWPYTNNCCSRIHIDFRGPFYGQMFMIIIVAYSKWPKVVDMNICTIVSRVNEEFSVISIWFTKTLNYDNGVLFTSKEFYSTVSSSNKWCS